MLIFERAKEIPLFNFNFVVEKFTAVRYNKYKGNSRKLFGKLEFDEGGLDMIETIILCSILAIIVFGIQFVLCNKANNKSVKRIPMYIILALYAIALILCLVDWLDGSGGVAIWVIFAFIISIANTVALVADIVAWVVYKQIQKKKK